jgi:nitroimidazol reductase NimA-like FMN-containing flavoprotein (pyridoxamine 5'-phosphate oxidase superfamily)
MGSTGLKTRVLDQAAAVSILQRNSVGRLAFVRANRLTIVPVNYVYADNWLYGRSSDGEKIRGVASNAYNWWPVVFEVDEVDYVAGTHVVSGWRSVVVHGGIEILDEPYSGREQAINVIRTFEPEAFAPNDPFPARNIIFRISAMDTTAREAVPEGAADSSESRSAAMARPGGTPAGL